MAALCNAVLPYYNNRESETERDRSGQGHTGEEIHLARYGHTEEGSGADRVGQGRSSQIMVGYSAC